MRWLHGEWEGELSLEKDSLCRCASQLDWDHVYIYILICESDRFVCVFWISVVFVYGTFNVYKLFVYIPQWLYLQYWVCNIWGWHCNKFHFMNRSTVSQLLSHINTFMEVGREWLLIWGLPRETLSEVSLVNDPELCTGGKRQQP